MGDEYLVTGFADVDGSGDMHFYSKCLGLIDSLPYYKRVNRESFRRLRLCAGLSVLDVGCGLGNDVFCMAHLVSPGGKVVGFDSSSALINEARCRDAGCKAFVDFLVADARDVLFA